LTHLEGNFFCSMFKIRFFIAVAIYAAISIILPFIVPVPAKTYVTLMGVFTLGYLFPAVLAVRQTLARSAFLWLAGALVALVLYDYLKSQTEAGYVFMANWRKYYPAGLLIFLGIQSYARFTSEFVLKQLMKK